MSTLSQILQEDQLRYSDPAPQLPWSVQLCITYGCNRAPLKRNQYTDANGCIRHKGGCTFCGMASMIDKATDRVGFPLMTVSTAVEVAKQLNDWVPGRRIEINNFGEPWMNPNWDKIVKALREYYSSTCIQLSTNGINSYRDYNRFSKLVDKFFDNGGNLLSIDAYEGSYSTYMEFAKKYGADHGIKVIDFIHDNPDKLTYYRNAGTETKELYVVDDLGECDYKASNKSDKKAQRCINNHSGCVMREVWEQYGIDESALPLKKKCSRVYRELIIGFDGTVTVCCQDFLRRINLGNIKDTNIRDIWNSHNFNTIRRKLYDADRGFITPCALCSYTGGFRLGFLKRPDGIVTDDDLRELYRQQRVLSEYIHYNATNNCITLSTGEKLNIEPKMDRELYLKSQL